MPTEAQRGKRICPFCGECELALEEIRMALFGMTTPVDVVWYCQNCDAIVPEEVCKEDNHNGN